MAGIPYHVVVSPIMQSMLYKFDSPLLRDFGSDCEIEKELCQLRKTLKETGSMLDFAELNQQKNKLLRLSLEGLRDLAYYADDMLDEFIYEAQRRKLEDERNHNRSSRQVHNFLSFSLNDDQLLRRHEIAPLVTSITEKLVDIENKLKPHYFHGPIERRQHDMQSRLKSFSTRSKGQKTGSSVDNSNVFGRTEDLNDITNMLLSEEYNQRGVSIVAIVGLGGIGKTTLAQLVYNHPSIEQHFDVRSWVCVSEDFDVTRLTRAILESATRKTFGFKDLQPLQSELEDTLRGKRFLLVLDDVWNENGNTWEDLRVPFRVASKGSTIIVTTRSQRVSSVMGAMKTLDLKVLSNEDGWLLFKKRAFNYNDSDAHPNLELIGKKIVAKCKGLPLAVKTIGGLLNENVDEEEWQNILDSEMWDLEGFDVLPSLSLSYHHLPSHLKLCFAYCSLFPKDYEFNKKTLVRCWMAEGFVLSRKVERMENIGGQYFDILFHRSFFQKVNWQDNETFVMHDLMHDLAQFVSSRMCFRMDFDKSCEIYENARHMSVNIWDVDLLDNEFYKCRRLSTFLGFEGHMIGGNYGSMVPRDLFDTLRCLRVLDLQCSPLKRLPESIGNLKHLRYLNLSRTPISVLPEQTCNLYNLQTLILQFCCRLRKLPTNMGNLINLQHLIINCMYWSQPQGEIGRLTCLKTLPLLSVGQENGFKIKELKELRHLEGRLSLSKLENVVNIMEAKEANLKNKQNLDDLVLQWSHKISHLGDRGDVDEAILEGLQPHTGLKSLNIDGYCGLRFPSWMMTYFSCYNKLVSVILNSCRNCKIVPPLGQLCFLKKLVIRKLDGVEYFSVAKEGEFRCLQHLRLEKCSKLKTLPALLPAVKELEIISCGVLTMLPKLPTISKLLLQNCDKRILNWVHQCTSIQSLIIQHIQDATSLPPAMLQPLAALQTLTIYNFDNLVSLSEDVGLQDLVSLRGLEIRRCYRLTSLPNRLHTLSSLKEITVEGCGFVVLFPEEASLPPVLNRLHFYTCPQLESLTNKLKSLSSLQELHISWCPLASLPEEGLPTSLRTLIIENCPELESRCREGGEDWHRIAHIPELDIRPSHYYRYNGSHL